LRAAGAKKRSQKNLHLVQVRFVNIISSFVCPNEPPGLNSLFFGFILILWLQAIYVMCNVGIARRIH
jgi:hypothetical protein